MCTRSPRRVSASSPAGRCSKPRASASSRSGSSPGLVVAGVAASGARVLVDAAIRRRQLDEVARGRASLPTIAGTLEEVAAQLGVGATASARGWLERVARAVRAAPARIVVELADDPRGDELIAALVRAAGDHPVIAIVDPDQLQGTSRIRERVGL